MEDAQVYIQTLSSAAPLYFRDLETSGHSHRALGMPQPLWQMELAPHAVKFEITLIKSFCFNLQQNFTNFQHNYTLKS